MESYYLSNGEMRIVSVSWIIPSTTSVVASRTIFRRVVPGWDWETARMLPQRALTETDTDEHAECSVCADTQYKVAAIFEGSNIPSPVPNGLWTKLSTLYNYECSNNYTTYYIITHSQIEICRIRWSSGSLVTTFQVCRIADNGTPLMLACFPVDAWSSTTIWNICFLYIAVKELALSRCYYLTLALGEPVVHCGNCKNGILDIFAQLLTILKTGRQKYQHYMATLY